MRDARQQCLPQLLRLRGAQSIELEVLLGAGAAVGLRIIFAVVVSYLLNIPFLKVVGALLLFWLGAVAAPGDEVAPGMVLLIGGAGGLALGAALVVRVMRALLRQAVEMRAELAEVI